MTTPALRLPLPLLLAMLTAIGPLSIDMYLPAMAAMAGSLSSDIHHVELSVSTFLLGFALGQITGGPLSDRVGRRPVIFLGLILFGIASIALTYVSSLDGLLLLRGLQAIGGGLAVVNSTAIVRDNFDGTDIAKVLSMVAMIMMAAPLAAPLLGSLVLSFSGWRSIFGILSAYAAILIAIPLGVISAVKQNTWIDYVVRIFSIAGVAMPSFWLGILIILGLLIFSQARFGEPWMPPIEYVSPFEDLIANLSQLIWPAVAVGYRYSSVTMRMTRSALLEVLREDYIRTARAKGLEEKVVINRHALKNAFLPVVTVIGIEFAFLMGGLVVTEQVFNLNGLGRLLIESVLYQDYNMIQALVMLMVVVFVCVNFAVDLLYAWLDPRIRYS